MLTKTRSGLTITYAPFWLVWIGPDDGGPERFPYLRVTRPPSGRGIPLTDREALDWWLHRAANDCTASPEAEEYLYLLRDA